MAYLDSLPTIGVLRDRQATLAPHVLCAAKHAGEVNGRPALRKSRRSLSGCSSLYKFEEEDPHAYS